MPNTKLICSLSGGIDSPVSSFLMMKCGCKIVFVHILNRTQTGEAVLSKIDKLVKQLSKTQPKSKLYIVPFENIQKQLIMNVPSKLRMIVYRRFMLRIINSIAKREKAQGIVTGDSLGQVASQTLDNLNCIYAASKLPVLSPLIGMDKVEIINIAKKIGTYDHSIIPYPDCCSFMLGKYPETRAEPGEIERIESFIENQEKLIEESVSNAEVKVI